MSGVDGGVDCVEGVFEFAGDVGVVGVGGKADVEALESVLQVEDSFGLVAVELVVVAELVPGLSEQRAVAGDRVAVAMRWGRVLSVSIDEYGAGCVFDEVGVGGGFEQTAEPTAVVMADDDDVDAEPFGECAQLWPR